MWIREGIPNLIILLIFYVPCIPLLWFLTRFKYPSSLILFTVTSPFQTWYRRDSRRDFQTSPVSRSPLWWRILLVISWIFSPTLDYLVKPYNIINETISYITYVQRRQRKEPTSMGSPSPNKYKCVGRKVQRNLFIKQNFLLEIKVQVHQYKITEKP